MPLERQQQQHSAVGIAPNKDKKAPSSSGHFRRANANANSSSSSTLHSILPFWSQLSPRNFLFLFALCFGSVLLVAMLAVKSQYRHRMPSSIPGNADTSNGHSTRCPDEKLPPAMDTNEVRAMLFSAIQPERMASTLRLITQEPHPAGTEANRRVAERLAELWQQNGVEKVRLHEYDVLLSYPNWTTPNHATVLSEQGDVLFQSLGLSPDLIPPDGGGNDYRASIQWLAYSAPGTVEGEPVYCHYGQPEDFERLEKKFGIADLKGKIALIRYGEDFRGDKVKHAQQRQAAGVILISDPAEVAPEGGERTFPHAIWMPSAGVQRGSIMSLKGDPLTPLLPARKDFQRGRTIQQVIAERILPSIPVLPLGYADAEQILSRMGGPGVPTEWQGGMNIPYRIGPGFEKGKGDKLRLEVHSELNIRTIQNVIGVIRGREEPDSWVLLGNHYDAWVFGALDPNSGSAILAEVARAFANAARRGWRPRRTLIFCNWDGEEHGLIGSTEFVQEYADLLRDRAVVYLNLDLISSNQSLAVRTVPSLYKAVTDAAKLVQNPMAEERAQGRAKVFDSWKAYFPPDVSWLPDTPKMKLPSGGSDHMSFLNYLGVPVVDFTYQNASMNLYPLYHSRYEVPFVNEHLFDHNNLTVHKAVGEYWTELALAFSDSPMVPISATLFARKLLKDYLEQVRQAVLDLHAKFPAESETALQQMDKLLAQAHLFLQQANQFERDAELARPEWANRRLQKLDQCFVNPSMGLAEKEPEKRHVLFSLSDDDTYSASVMAAVQQKIAEVAAESDVPTRAELGRQLALQLTVVQYSVLCATNTLKPFI